MVEPTIRPCSAIERGILAAIKKIVSITSEKEEL